MQLDRPDVIRSIQKSKAGILILHVGLLIGHDNYRNNFWFC